MLRFESEQQFRDFQRRRKAKRPAPVRKARTETEEQLQKSVVDYLNLVSKGKFRFFHIPGGGHISAGMGARRKRMGAKAGAPDLILEIAGGRLIEIELKADKGRLSKSQVAWQKESFEMGIPYFVARSIEEIRAILRGANLL